jgi:hypothetical protein
MFRSCNGHRGWDVTSKVMSQVGNDGEGGRRTIDSAVELDSLSIVNQHVFTMQLAMFLLTYIIFSL